jgi:hypothetical protein
VWNRQGILHSLTIASGPRADSFAWLMQLESWIQSRHDGQTRIRFWWDDEAPGYDMLDSAAALYLDRRAVLAEAFSAPGSDELRQHLSPKVTLVYLSRHPERIPERLSTLTSRGFTISNGPSVTLPFHHDDIRVTLYEVAPARGSVQ